MLQDILKRCSKKNAPVQFHVEDKGYLTFQELSQICSKANYPKSIALRHFAPADVSPSFTSKDIPSRAFTPPKFNASSLNSITFFKTTNVSYVYSVLHP